MGGGQVLLWSDFQPLYYMSCEVLSNGRSKMAAAVKVLTNMKDIKKKYHVVCIHGKNLGKKNNLSSSQICPF